MKLFVDDIRDPPDPSWTVARSTKDALKLCTNDWPLEMALDHDLGGSDRIMDFLKGLHELCGDRPIPRWTIHSANPVGRLNIESFMNSWERSRKD